MAIVLSPKAGASNDQRCMTGFALPRGEPYPNTHICCSNFGIDLLSYRVVLSNGGYVWNYLLISR